MFYTVEGTGSLFEDRTIYWGREDAIGAEVYSVRYHSAESLAEEIKSGRVTLVCWAPFIYRKGSPTIFIEDLLDIVRNEDQYRVPESVMIDFEEKSLQEFCRGVELATGVELCVAWGVRGKYLIREKKK